MLLDIRHVAKTFGSVTVLNDISLILNAGERIGVVGANGVGKSTLLHIINGTLEADSGSITFAPHVEHGFLHQQMQLHGQTIQAVLWDAQRTMRELQTELDHLASMMNHDASPTMLQRYGDLAERFEQRGGYEIDFRMAQVLSGLGLDHLDRETPVERLSGGEKTRLGLAALLLSAPDVLLLDEPTNHLDVHALEWLETYLIEQRGGMITVSHDRQFLNRIATSIIEIDEHSHETKTYAGNYDAYAAAKQTERHRWAEEYERQQEQIKALQQRIKTASTSVAHNRSPKDGDKFIYNAKGENVATAVSRNIRSAEQELARIQADPIPEPPEPLVFKPRFDPTTSGSDRVLIGEDLSYRFGERVLFEHVDCEVYPLSRIVLTGANGAGKTTLLNLLAGQLPLQTGTIRLAPNITLGLLAQEYQRADPHLSLLDVYRAQRQGFDKDVINELIWSGLFKYDEIQRPVGSVSVGQYHKLQLAFLLAHKANVLLLDEPTNHFSFDVLEQLEAALRSFRGAIIAISHDRRFIQQFGGEQWHLANGRLHK